MTIINKDTRLTFLEMLDQKIAKAKEDESILRDLHEFALLSVQEYKLLEATNKSVLNISYNNDFLSHELIEEKRKIEALFNALDEVQCKLTVLNVKLPRNYSIEARFPENENLKNSHVGVNGLLKLIRDNKQSGAFRIISNFCVNYFGEEIYFDEFNQFDNFFINEILK